MIVLSFCNVRTEGVLQTHWDALVGILANVEIRIDGRLWYSELHVSLIELADAVATWLKQPSPVTFAYSSLDSEEPWLIRFVCLGPHGWRLEAYGAEFVDSGLHSTDEVREGAERFVAAVGKSVPDPDRVLPLLEGQTPRYSDLLSLWELGGSRPSRGRPTTRTVG